MLARRDGGDMKVIPIKLREGDLDIPVQFGHLQYLRFWEHPDVDELVKLVIGAIGRGTPVKSDLAPLLERGSREGGLVVKI
jgi:hypothetical protein